MAERVDKSWKQRGLEGYSTQAILGTLGHYGVSVDEAALAAEVRYPMELALSWKAAWRGTGQFVDFPWAAANELTTRLRPEALTPAKLAQAVLEVVACGLRSVEGDEPAFGPALEAAEALTPGLPSEPGRRDAFFGELVEYLQAWARPFNELPVRLARAGRGDEARRLAALAEALFPDKAGCVVALVRAESGEREAALADVESWAMEATRDVYARASALDALYALGAREAARGCGLAVFDAAAAAGKWGLADSVGHLLAQVADGADAGFRAEAQRRLVLAHARGGGHH